jgi:predicted house-cleaning noncanonical NTP pyrophosphatase (MazG superfamily)
MLLFDDSQKLEKALGAEAAAVLAHVFERADEQWRQDLATKADLQEIRNDLSERISDVRVEVQTVRVELIERIAALDNRVNERIAALDNRVNERIGALDNRISDVRVEMQAMRNELMERISDVRVETRAIKNELIKWMVGGFITQTALLMAVLAVVLTFLK